MGGSAVTDKDDKEAKRLIEEAKKAAEEADKLVREAQELLAREAAKKKNT
jgi:hypothetical protein